MALLVATDLDGTLLDTTYPKLEAALAIDSVAQAYPGVCVVLASSKTLPEMIDIAKLCESDPLLLFENGAGFAWRETRLCGSGSRQYAGFEVECTGVDYAQIREVLLALRRSASYQFRGFGDMTVAEVAERTGLDTRSAADARDRLATEPIEWLGDASSLEQFRADLASWGLGLERGGQFHHVASHMNKQRALRRLVKQIRYQTGDRVITLACGDAPNDLDMLQQADRALVFPQSEGGYLLPEGEGVWHAPKAGPATWLACVSRVIESQAREALAI